MNPEALQEQLARINDEAREMERLKALGAVELDADGQREQPELIAADVGIHNRAAARRFGLRNSKKARPMAVPSKRARHRTRRSR